MRGKWAAGIEPRNFTWVFRGVLAVAERPGGSTPVHRRVRRDEELLWLKHQGFARVVSIMPATANLDDYGPHGLAASHYPLRGGPQQREILDACYRDLRGAQESRVMTLLHGDDVSDRLLGVLAGYLVWGRRVESVPAAIALIERLFKRSLGPDGREVLANLPTPLEAP